MMNGWVKLKDIAHVLNGYAFKSNNYVKNGIRIIRITNVQKGYIEDNDPKFYPIEALEEVKGFRLYENDLLMSLTGNVGRVAFLRKEMLPAALNQRVACIRIKEGAQVKKEFLYHFMNSDVFELKCIESANGVAQKNLSTEWLKEFRLYLPSIEKQGIITKVLDHLSDLITREKQQLKDLDLLIKSRFIEMFGDTRNNTFNYPICRLEDHIEFLTSGSRGWAKYCTDEGSEWFITIKNVKDCHISVENMQSINAPLNAEAIRTKVQVGDLLVSITADLGRTGVVTKEIAEHGAYINQHLTCIRLNKACLNPLYVAYFMESPAGKEQFDSKNQSAVKAGLNFNSINSLRIVVPPIDKQNSFVSFVAQVDKSKLAVQQSLNELETLKKSLMQQYFG